MANIGDILSVPETGWKRYDDKDINIQYVANTTTSNNAGAYNGSYTQYATGQAIGTTFFRFNFTGDKIRLITRLNSYSNDLKVLIDGVEVGSYSHTPIIGTNVYMALSYEKTNLSNTEHYIEVINNTTLIANLDAVDIDVNGELKPYREIIPVRKLTIRNTATSKDYSLVNKTLIHLPSSSDKNIILHGIESGKEIKLDEYFDKMKYVKDISEVLGSGKTFTHAVNMSNTKINKIIL